MKKIILIILYFLFLQLGNTQTFRPGFDNRDASPSGGNGQGVSFHSNVSSKFHNDESVFLIGYITMFDATKDKKYLDQFAIKEKMASEGNGDFFDGIFVNKNNHTLNLNHKEVDSVQLTHGFSLGANGNYLLTEQYSNDNFSYSFDLTYLLRINKHFLFQTGIIFDDLKSYSKLNLSIGGTLINRTTYDHYRFIAVPMKFNFLYELGKIQFKTGFGSAFSILAYNHSIVEDDVNGIIEKSRFNEWSKIIVFTAACGINYSYNKNISIGINGEFRHSLTPLKEWTTNTSGETIHYDRSLKYFVFGFYLDYFFN